MLYRLFFPEGLWRIKHPEHPMVYLTFDDGPVPEVTPKVLEILEHYGIQATFFMVGDNARRHPQLLEAVRKAGHSVGNHTMHHMQGRHNSWRDYARDVEQAASFLDTLLFRPPHGIIRPKQMKVVNNRYNVIMYDLVTRDYAQRLTAADVFNNVRRFARNGSIIVFHDSLKAAPRMLEALPRTIEWLKSQGFHFGKLNQRPGE